jgi:hypothetical protein
MSLAITLHDSWSGRDRVDPPLNPQVKRQNCRLVPVDLFNEHSRAYSVI